LDPYGTDFPCHLAYHRYNRERGRMSGQLRIRVRYRNHASPWFDYLFASRDEIKELVEETAWEAAAFAPKKQPSFVVTLSKRKVGI
jgi:sugar/nucleoside kinase (ribokinase family)